MDQRGTAQTCYTMAYFVLPQYVFNQREKLIGELSAGRIGAMFFYVLTCKMGGKEPNPEVVQSLMVHKGSLDDNHNYYIIQYPTPVPVDISELPDDQVFQAMQNVVLAPYFSAVIEDNRTKEARYFILGQSPDGHTTLRGVTLEYNANLGRGCEPELELFLTLLRSR